MIDMANRIADYFQAYPEERAREGVLEHIRKFWPPNMRSQLAVYQGTGGDGLHPLVAWSAAQLREMEASPGK